MRQTVMTTGHIGIAGPMLDHAGIVYYHTLGRYTTTHWDSILEDTRIVF